MTLYVSMQYLDQCKNNTNSGVFVSEEEQQHIIFLCFLFMLVPALSASYQNQREQQYSSAFGLNRLAQQPIRNPKFPQKKASLETASNKLGTKHTTIFSFFHPVCKLCLETSNLVWGACLCYLTTIHKCTTFYPITTFSGN